MRILAIDPGNEQSAWCLYSPDMFISGKCDNAALLRKLRGVDSDFPSSADSLAVEMIASYGMAVGKEVFDTCLWIGRFVEAWSSHYRNHPAGRHSLVYRKEVKLFHCNSVRATDANIRASLIDRYGPGKEKAIGNKKSPGPLYGIKGDEWSALAVAITAANGATMPSVSGNAKLSTTAK